MQTHKTSIQGQVFPKTASKQGICSDDSIVDGRLVQCVESPGNQPEQACNPPLVVTLFIWPIVLQHFTENPPKSVRTVRIEMYA